MASKRKRQTFEKMKREQTVRERREKKQERKAAARLRKAAGGMAPEGETGPQTEEAVDGSRIALDSKEAGE